VHTDLTNLGAVWQRLGDYERALACLEEAVRLYETTQGSYGLAPTLYNIGNVHRKLGDYERALEYYQRYYDICMQGGNKSGHALGLTAMATVCWEQGKTDDSLRLYNEAVQMARDIRYAQGLSQACVAWEIF
jgi:tetratricopeptide (TPR) repeat protein